MCPKGHSLLLRSDSVVGRWRWAAHARRCAACAEVRTAARFVEAFAGRAGRWPVAGEAVRVRGARRAWRLAGALAVVAVLLPLLLSGLWPRRDRAGAASVRGIHTVHWVGAQTIDGITTPREETIQYPNRRRLSTEEGLIITDLGADRELMVLADYTTLPWHPKPYRYLLERPLNRYLTPPEWFTLAGHLDGPGDGGRKLLRHQVSRLSDGQELHTLEYDDPKLPWLRPVTRLWVDPGTGLVLAWDITDGWDTADGRHIEQRQVADYVEYNLDLPEDYFSTEPPRGEEIVDRFTPDGIRRDYLAALAELESLPADKQAALATEWRDNGCFNKLDYLSPRDQAEIKAKLSALGVTRGEVALAAQPRKPQRGSHEAQAQRDRDPAQKVLLEPPPPHRGMAPPLTKEQIEERHQVQALSRTQSTEAQPAQLEKGGRAARKR
jgi:hypothetical protein